MVPGLQIETGVKWYTTEKTYCGLAPKTWASTAFQT